MRRTTIVAGVGCAVLSVAAAGCGSDNGGTKFVKHSITAKEKNTNDFFFADNPPKTTLGKDGPARFSPGDHLGFHNQLAEGGKVVGDLYGHCVVITGTGFGNAAGDCEGVFQLQGGKVYVHVGGTGIFGDHVTGGITGGSGAYAGANGTFTSNGGRISTDTLTFTTPK